MAKISGLNPLFPKPIAILHDFRQLVNFYVPHVNQFIFSRSLPSILNKQKQKKHENTKIELANCNHLHVSLKDI